MQKIGALFAKYFFIHELRMLLLNGKTAFSKRKKFISFMYSFHPVSQIDSFWKRAIP